MCVTIRARPPALRVRWLLGASEEAGAGGLLGLHQLLQALQHRQTQGLEPGGRHSQEDSLLLEGTGRGRAREHIDAGPGDPRLLTS